MKGLLLLGNNCLKFISYSTRPPPPKFQITNTTTTETLQHVFQLIFVVTLPLML